MKFHLSSKKLKILGLFWIALFGLIAFHWTFSILLNYGALPWVWDYITPGLGGLGFLIMPNIFYFALAEYADWDASQANFNADKRKFYYTVTLIITLAMMWGFYNWVEGLLEYYQAGFQEPAYEVPRTEIPG